MYNFPICYVLFFSYLYYLNNLCVCPCVTPCISGIPQPMIAKLCERYLLFIYTTSIEKNFAKSKKKFRDFFSAIFFFFFQIFGIFSKLFSKNFGGRGGLRASGVQASEASRPPEASLQEPKAPSTASYLQYQEDLSNLARKFKYVLMSKLDFCTKIRVLEKRGKKKV